MITLGTHSGGTYQKMRQSQFSIRIIAIAPVTTQAGNRQLLQVGGLVAESLKSLDTVLSRKQGIENLSLYP